MFNWEICRSSAINGNELLPIRKLKVEPRERIVRYSETCMRTIGGCCGLNSIKYGAKIQESEKCDMLPVHIEEDVIFYLQERSLCT